VCSGAFLLAAAGVLDGRRATTHWTACGALADNFPAVEVDPKPIFVRDVNVWTVVLAHEASWKARRRGPDIADWWQWSSVSRPSVVERGRERPSRRIRRSASALPFGRDAAAWSAAAHSFAPTRETADPRHLGRRLAECGVRAGAPPQSSAPTISGGGPLVSAARGAPAP
jgi:hypothetical protein